MVPVGTAFHELGLTMFTTDKTVTGLPDRGCSANVSSRCARDGQTSSTASSPATSNCSSTPRSASTRNAAPSMANAVQL